MSLKNEDLNFEEPETKELLAQYDFEYFLRKNIEEHSYKSSDIENLFLSYKEATKKMKTKSRVNRRQYNFFCEGQVRKMFKGQVLTGLFNLDETRESTIFNFPAYGEDWAWFEHWRKYQRRKLTKEKGWRLVTRVGAIAGIILSIIKLGEYLHLQNALGYHIK